MVKKVIVSFLIAAVLMAGLPVHAAKADAGEVPVGVQR